MLLDSDTTLTTRQAGVLLGVSLRTVQLWVEAGVLDAWKTAGGHRRVSTESVNKIIEERGTSFKRQSNIGNRSNGRSLNVLIAEDDQVYKELLEYFFKNLNTKNSHVNLTLVSNGFECLISLGKFQPDLVISDLNMPNLSGFDVINYLSSTEEYKNIKIIALTDLTKEAVKAKGALPKSIEVFTKPFSFNQLEVIINQMIEDKKKVNA